jgi:hypothetical protein
VVLTFGRFPHAPRFSPVSDPATVAETAAEGSVFSSIRLFPEVFELSDGDIVRLKIGI